MSSSVTVVMATYNGEKHLAEQIKSLLNQTVLPEKIIIVDDHSTDSTITLLYEMLNECPIAFEVVHHDDNEGVNKTFQDGIELVTTKYTMICDQDDVWDKKKIELCLESITSNDVMVVCNAQIVDSHLVSTGRTMFEFINLPLEFKDNKCRLTSEEMLMLLLKRNYVTGMCLMGKTEIIKKAFPIPNTMTYDTWISWVVSGYGSVVFLNNPLVLYRQHNNNAIGAQKAKEKLKEYYSHRNEDLIKLHKKYITLAYANESVSKVERDVYQASLFYNNRIKMDELNSFRALLLLFSNIINGNYKKYSPSFKKELIKDFLGLFF